MRAVVDTNVLLSGLFWRGRPHALIEQVRAGTLTLISSPALLAVRINDQWRVIFRWSGGDAGEVCITDYH